MGRVGIVAFTKHFVVSAFFNNKVVKQVHLDSHITCLVSDGDLWNVYRQLK